MANINKIQMPNGTEYNIKDDVSGYITSAYHDSTKQDALVSGTNIKTINSQSILGSGNIEIQGGGGVFYATYNVTTIDECIEAYLEGKALYMLDPSSDYDGVLPMSRIYYRKNDATNSSIYFAQAGTNRADVSQSNIIYSVTGSGWIISNKTLANTDLSNLSATGEAHFVKSSSLSNINPMITSYVSGTSGYNIWANGYCEQWGVIIKGFTGTVNFIKTFANSNILVFIGGLTTRGSASYDREIYPNTITSTGFTTTNSFGNGGISGFWLAKGYLASGQY